MPTQHQDAEANADQDAAFHLARSHWRLLSADPQHWTDPQQQRALAAAFLRYHAAKLALEETTPRAQ